MTTNEKTELEKIIDERIIEKLYQLGIRNKECNNIINDYPKRYMKDSWYND